MTSSNGNIFRVTGHLCGEFTGLRWIPPQRPVTRSFDVFFDLCPNKQLSKHSWGWWFETPSGSLWRHSNGKTSVFLVNRGPGLRCAFGFFVATVKANSFAVMRCSHGHWSSCAAMCGVAWVNPIMIIENTKGRVYNVKICKMSTFRNNTKLLLKTSF